MDAVGALLSEVKVDADAKGADLVALLLRQIDRQEEEARERLANLRGGVCEHQYEMESYFAVKKVWIAVKRILWREEIEHERYMPRLMRGWVSPCTESKGESLETKERRLYREWKSQRRRYRQLTPCGSCWMCRTKKTEVWRRTKAQQYHDRSLQNERNRYTLASPPS